MSKQAKEFFAQLREGEQRTGAMEAVKEGVQAVAPGLSLSNILSDIGSELKQQAAHGAHELAAALFNGSPFVMYPRSPNGKEDPQHGLSPEAQQQEQSHGGREM
jgi:hypothetical protein